ncbi:TetR/AcrR family transcriptional regulator (plasmid) [Georgenia sp. TF02-10]|uniref:TetR/AcrR family transcriptional regulator n=1 Tax=Georgenia sp. TF02-10 TaxID=2917725 RepID=UPI001FA6AC3B|nr:TetR/AcrR family transcriptional regulator [Georgenia sp. TF02-10]UNX56601.1 TetR/AcrR family transcriptional regulator [Georgenia sp. TF02-10]
MTGNSQAAPMSPTAQRILDVAAQMFFTDGYAATSVRRIMTACDVTAGSMYNHFASKEDVLYAILERSHDDTLTVLRSGLDAAGEDPGAQLAALVEAISRFHTERQVEGIVSQREWRHLPRERAQAILVRQREVREIFERVLRRGADDGSFSFVDRGVDVDITAKAILDLCMNAGRWFRHGGRVSSAELARQHVAMVMAMVGNAS